MSETLPPPDQPAIPRKRRWRWLKWLAVLAIVLLVFGELFARFYLGLGDPPLSVYDPDMEYRFAPSSTFHRFGNLIHYNQWSQRADDFPQHKSDPNELRVMVVGDSIVNGGVLSGQGDTCTALLQEKLRDALHRKVIVGNISAGSWGPPNELAYLKKFGLFDADVVLFQFSGQDATDVMTWEAMVGAREDYPDHTPFSALWEGWLRYGWPRIAGRFGIREPFPDAPPTVPDDQATEICMGAIRDMVGMARASGARVIVGLHQKKLPIRLAPEGVKIRAGYAVIRKQAQDLGIEPIDWTDKFDEAMNRGQEPYRPGDDLHPSVLGNRIIADVMFPAVRDALLAPPTKPTTRPTTSNSP